MSPVEKKTAVDDLSGRLATSGFRFTPQRRHVYDVLLGERDHPTAEEVFLRAKRGMPDISMATVYNCLDILVRSGVARQVTVDRGATRFCPNMREHCHFYCDACENVFDLELRDEGPAIVPLPKGFKAVRFEIAIHGVCARCAGREEIEWEFKLQLARGNRLKLELQTARIDIVRKFNNLTGSV